MRILRVEQLGPADMDAVARVCAERGAEGWELCGLLNVAVTMPPQLDGGGLIVGAGGKVPGVALIFKRPVVAVSPTVS